MLEALRSERNIDRLLVADGIEVGSQMREIFSLAENAGIRVDHLQRRELDRQSQTKKSQGVVAVLPDTRYVSVEDLIFEADRRSQAPLIAVLDGIVDPHNLGAIARTMDAAGGHGIIIPERRAAGISPGAIRASAGALMHLPVARVVNIPSDDRIPQHTRFADSRLSHRLAIPNTPQQTSRSQPRSWSAPKKKASRA